MGESPLPKHATIVLAGGVVKGAFEAGVLHVLAARGIGVRRIVAVSSGALNGVVFAAGVRAKRERTATSELIELWMNEGHLTAVTRINFRNLLRGLGVSDSERLMSLLRRNVKPSHLTDPGEIELQILVASLTGRLAPAGPHAAVTYSRVFSFGPEAFDSEARLEDVFRCATASAAFPLLYAPVKMPEVGLCIDGGLLGDLPIRYMDNHQTTPPIDAVIFVEPTAAESPFEPANARGLSLLGHLLDMLFRERRFQDMRLTFGEQAGMIRLSELAATKGWTAGDVEAIKDAIGWNGKYCVPVVPVRPLRPLPGDVLSGLVRKELRNTYIEIGVERAVQVFDELGWRG